MDVIESILHNQKEIERVFAAAAYTDPRYVVEKCGWLAPEIIQDEQIGRFWKRILAGDDAVTASYETNLQPAILGWRENLPTILAALDLANQIAKHAWLASVGSRLGDIVKAISASDEDKVHEIVNALAGERRLTVLHPPNAEEIAAEFIDAVVADDRSIKTGFPGLDDNTGGLERQTMSVLAGRPSMGKSAAALQMACHVSGQMRQKVMFFSLEMSRINLWARVACPAVGVTWMDVRAKNLSDDQVEALLAKSAELSAFYGKNLMVEDSPGQTLESMWIATSSERPDLVVVDHLGLVEHPETNEVVKLGIITKRLKDMAKALDCHVMILAQLNRGVEDRKDKRPLLSDLRDSGKIEENADQVFMLYRDSFYHPTEVQLERNDVELWVRKFRDGVRNAKIMMTFSEREQSFDRKYY